MTSAVRWLFAALFAASAALPLRPVTDVPLPGSASRLDYQSLDARRHVLFIAHLGDDSIIAVDTKRLRVSGVVAGVSQVHGVLTVPERNRLYASATGTNELVAIDESSLRVVGRAAAGIYPDGIAYDPKTARLFVSDEQGGTDTVIDARSFRRIATIPLGGEVGNTQYDPLSGHIFVNAEGARAVVEIDPRSLRVLRRTPLPGCAGNHGLLMDGARRRIFIACEDNAMLFVLGRPAMRVEGRWRVGDNPDVLASNAGASVVYVGSESGTVSVFADGPAVQLLAQQFLAPQAHTVAVDPATHRVYFPLADIGGRPVLRVMRPL